MTRVLRRTSSVFTIPRPASNSAASQRATNSSYVSGSIRGRSTSTLSSPPLPSIVTSNLVAESPIREAAAEAQEIPSIALISPTPRPSIEEKRNPTEYILPTGYIPPRGYIPPFISSTVGNPGAFTDAIDNLPQLDIAQDPCALGPVEPHVELATLNPPEPAEPETIITEALVDEPIPYSVEPMEESIKDFESVDQVDNTAEFSEAVNGNANVISHEPFADPIAPRITQPVLDMPQYDTLGLYTIYPY